MKQLLILAVLGSTLGQHSTAAVPPQRKTTVTIVGEDFHINGQPTYAGRSWQGHRVEGLLMNSRMVQATFDDLNPEICGRRSGHPRDRRSYAVVAGGRVAQRARGNQQ